MSAALEPLRGVIVRFRPTQGFGFIRPPDAMMNDPVGMCSFISARSVDDETQSAKVKPSPTSLASVRTAATGQSRCDGRTKQHETVCLNWDAVQLVSEALREARARTEALKFQTVPDLAAALEDIRRSVPTVDRAEDLIRDREVA